MNLLLFVSLRIFSCVMPACFCFIVLGNSVSIEFQSSLSSAICGVFLAFQLFCLLFAIVFFILPSPLPSIRLRSSFDRSSSLIIGVYGTYVNFLPFL